MKPKRRNSRHTKRSQTKHPYLNLAADIIIDAMLEANRPANRKKKRDAQAWLQSEKCQRWADVCGVDISAALNHKDSLIKLED